VNEREQLLVVDVQNKGEKEKGLASPTSASVAGNVSFLCYKKKELL